MIADPYDKLDKYALVNLPAHFYAAGPAYCPQFYAFISDKGWFSAQERFDPTRRAYATSLDWALRALAGNSHMLGQTVVVALLRATVVDLASNVPQTALEVLSLLGEQQAAGIYAEQQVDELERCVSLCRLASICGQAGDAREASDLLNRAQKQAQGMHDLRSQAHALGVIAETANNLGQREVHARSSRQLMEIVGRQDWPIAALAREFQLLDRPEYLLALVAWDCKAGIDAYLRTEYTEKKCVAVAVLTKKALELGDQTLIEAIIPKTLYSDRTGVVEALAEAGASQDAFRWIDTWGQEGSDLVKLQLAVARGAGHRGDVDAILRAANYVLPPKDRSREAGDQTDLWSERLADGIRHGLTSAAGQLLGLPLDRLAVYMEGIDGLVEEHPDKARMLSQQVEKDLTRLGLWLYKQSQAYAAKLDPSGFVFREDKARPATFKVVGALVSAAAWLEKWLTKRKSLRNHVDLFNSEAQTGQLIWKVMEGNPGEAVGMLEEIQDVHDRDEAAVTLVDELVKRKEFQRALDVAGYIKNWLERRSALERIAQGLVKLPASEVRPLVAQVFSLSSLLPEGEALPASGILPVFAHAVGERGHFDWAVSMANTGDDDATLGVCAALAGLAAERRDRAWVDKMLLEIESVVSRVPFLRIPVESMQESLSDEPTAVPVVAQLAELSMALSRVANQETTRGAQASWQELALRAYRSAERHPWAELSSAWPMLANAAADLGDRRALMDFDKRIRKAGRRVPAGIPGSAEYARVYIIMGLTRLGNYVEKGKKPYPPVIQNMAKHNQALALAEMAQIIREMAPQKKAFHKTLDREFLDMRADALMQQSLSLLNLSDRDLSHLSLQPALSPLLKQTDLRWRPFASSLYSRRPVVTGEPLVTKPYLPQVNRLIEIYSHNRLFRQAELLAHDIKPEADRAVVFSNLIRHLLLAGYEDRAQAAIKELESAYAKWLGWIAIAEGNAERQPEKAVDLLTQHVLPHLWSYSNLKALPRIAQVIAALPAEQGMEAAQSLILAIAKKNRRVVLLLVLAVLMPGLARLLDSDDLEGMIKKILESESWWNPAWKIDWA